jgi:putative membrane protein
MDWNRTLALANATLTLISVICIILGVLEIRKKRVEKHRTYMLAAYASSFLFMALFVTRYLLFGTTRFKGSEWGLHAYQFVLYSHEPLAVVNIPLATIALVTGLQRSVRMHREIAPAAMYVWLYVAITGVMIAATLYLRT